MPRPKRFDEPQVVRLEPGTLRRLDAMRGDEERAALMRRWLMERLEAEERELARRETAA